MEVKYILLIFFSFLYLYSFAQCQFGVVHTATTDHCLYASEEVIWNKASKANVTISGNTLTKSGGINGTPDAGAASINTVKQNGWATATIIELNKSRIFGLSSTGPHLNATSSIQYGFQIRSDNNKLDIIEGVSYNSTNYTVAVGTILKIANERGVIKFYADGTLLRISSIVPAAVLVVDAVLQSAGSTLSDVKVVNGTDGGFVVDIPAGDLGSNVKYEWFKNTISQGPPTSGNTSFTDPSLNDNDVVYCQLTQTGGCAASVNSNSIKIKKESPSLFGDYYLYNNPTAYACLATTEQVMAFESMSNVLITDNNIAKILANDGDNAGAQSKAEVVNNGFAQTTIAETNTLRSFGLAPPGNDNSASTIKYGFYIRSDVKLQIIDQGSLISINNDTYASGEILKVHIDNNIVKYYRGMAGNILVYISSIAPTYPLRVDVALNGSNATVKNVMMGNGSTGLFNVTASPLATGSVYDWKINANPAPAATNSSNYTNPSLLNGDLITCTLQPGQVGCSITFREIAISVRSYGSDFYISNSASSIACAQTIEEVKFTNLINSTASANTITKFQGGDGQWNAGATSLNRIFNNGYAETDIRYTDRTQMFGISPAASPNNANDVSIYFGFVFYGNGK